MADDPPVTPPNTMIAGRYAVDTSQIIPDAGGGLQAYLARDRLAGDARRIALGVSRISAPRARHLKLLDEPVDNLMAPLGHGVALMAGGKSEGYFVVCALPPGPPVSAGLNAWPERALIDLVLKPVAAVLDFLHSRKLTHRAIRPNNVFQAAPGQPVTLGAAWAAPPAMYQPAVFESPYTAMCGPAGRGDGFITDDVYSLGVLLLTLATGKIPMSGMDDTAIIRAKLDLGSFAALTKELPLTGLVADLVRGMLAEDPDHRPLPAMLADVANIRSRRVAARPGRRSQNPLVLNEVAVSDAQSLAWGLFTDEKKAIQFLRSGVVTQWLRRSLGDASLATEIEDLVRGRVAEAKPGPWSDPLLVMRTISALNPRMPLCWRGLALWPDAFASTLAEGVASKPDVMVLAEELLMADIFTSWRATQARPSHPDIADLAQQRQLLQTGGAGGLLRLFYGLNPILPCRVPAMAQAWVASLPDLMRFFEHTAGDNTGASLIDMHIAAFIAARGDRKIEMQVTALTGIKDPASFRHAELALIREMQTRYHPSPMPGLAKWVTTRLRPELDRWRNKPRREAMRARYDVLAQAGSLSRLLDLAEDPAYRAADVAGVQRATHEMAQINAELAAIETDDGVRFANAEQFGQAIVGGIGLSAFILTALSVLFR